MLRGSTHEGAPARTARDAALRVLVEHASSYPDLIPRRIDDRGLSARDAALARTILGECLTRWITLSHILEPLSGRALASLEPPMRAVLLSGAAQLLLMDRIPAHAAIDESVAWAKDSIRPGAAGMVNAVLRKVARARGETVARYEHHADQIPLRDGSGREVRGVAWASEPKMRLAQRYALPRSTVRRWSRAHPDHAPELVAHTIVRPPTIVQGVDPAIASTIDSIEAHDEPGSFVFTGPPDALAPLLEAHPTMRVQDPASASVVARIPDNDPGLIVDLCAGQGTKTRQLLGRFPTARVIACEVDPERLGALGDALGSDARVRVAHADEVSRWTHRGADLVCADVPCTNSGVLARRAEARSRAMTGQLERLVALQRRILTAAHEITRPRGMLVYSTCSIEPEENERQIGWARETLGVETPLEHAALPAGVPGDPPRVYRDGAYCGVCVRTR